MNTYSGSSIVKTGGCGCGGSTTAAPAKCSCEGGGCGSCQNQDFVRPNFFAGQLLTEEDLQSLNNYVVAKNRLHNRQLFGAGVVCGLDVYCNPCGGGTVVINPGYALDCCGNDITVACATELDISKMVRDLRRDLLGGYDCGDPCDDKKPDPATSKPGTAVDPAKNPTADPTKVPEIVRHYCLYVRYCEEMTDPVSPYATDEPCGYQTCEPTRVREGFRFELRCPEPKQPQRDLFSRIWACIGDLASVEKVFRDSQGLERFHQQASQALENVERYPVPTYDPPAQIKEMTEARTRMDEKLKKLKPDSPEPEILEALEATRTLEKSPALFLSLDTATQVALLEKDKTLGPTLVDVGQSLATVKKSQLPPLIASLTLPFDRAYATAIVDTADEIGTNLGPTALHSPQTGLSIEAGFGPSFQVADKQLYRLRGEAMVLTASYHRTVNASLGDIREELLDRLDKSAYITDCALRTDIKRLALPANEQDAGDLYGKVKRSSSTFEQLLAGLKRYLLGCICAAVNPPCTSCDDTSVKLACLEVKDCEVLNICNLDRTFVLTGPTLRYWLSLGRLGELIEGVCCPEPKPAIDAHASPYGDAKNMIQRAMRQGGGDFTQRSVLSFLSGSSADTAHKTPDAVASVATNFAGFANPFFNKALSGVLNNPAIAETLARHMASRETAKPAPVSTGTAAVKEEIKKTPETATTAPVAKESPDDNTKGKPPEAANATPVAVPAVAPPEAATATPAAVPVATPPVAPAEAANATPAAVPVATPPAAPPEAANVTAAAVPPVVPAASAVAPPEAATTTPAAVPAAVPPAAPAVVDSKELPKPKAKVSAKQPKKSEGKPT